MTQDDLLTALHHLMNSEVHTIVNDRIAAFHAFQTQVPDAVFHELCYCILTANCKADICLTIQHKLSHTFSTGNTNDIEQGLRHYHYRFPPRAAHITTARRHKETLLPTLHRLQGEDRRRFLVDTIPGLGYKEASHFLRNIGFDDYAIIDTHILEILDQHGIVKRPHTLTPKRYLKIETILRDLANDTGLTLAELDLYLWHMDTGTIVK